MDTDEPNIRVTSMSKLDREDKTIDWWKMMAPGDHASRALLPEGHNLWSDSVNGMCQMLAELHLRHPKAFYIDKTENPVEDLGFMVEFRDVHGNREWKINKRALPECIRLAKAMKPGSGDDHPDTLIVLKFMGLVFGRDGRGGESDELKYELDTLAFMAQKKGRPGNALLLQGPGGCGKSVYASMLSLAFNGKGSKNWIAGAELATESAQHFAWMKAEGARILELRELVKFQSKGARTNFEGRYKLMVDAGEAGDQMSITDKKETTQIVKNHCRIVATTNATGIIPMDAQERRTFYVVTHLVPKQMPLSWWKHELKPVTTKEERMAFFMRYLLDRDIEDYDENDEPPVSDGKTQEIRMNINEADKRHMTDVVEALMIAGRNIVTLGEVTVFMSAISHNEFQNTGEGGLVRYKSGTGGNVGTVAMHVLDNEYIKLDRTKTRKDGKNYTIYVRRGSDEEQLYGTSEKDALDKRRRSKLAKVINMDELLNALDHDRIDHEVDGERHLSKAVRGPLTPPEPDSVDGGDFDDQKGEEAF